MGGGVGCKPLKAFNESNISKRKGFGLKKEKSAGVIWLALAKNNFFPLMWNIFPFHPYKYQNGQFVNRTPDDDEINEHWHFVKDLLNLFPSIKEIYAVGRKAEEHLRYNGFSVKYIRHPSHMGENECREGIKKAAERFATQKLASHIMNAEQGDAVAQHNLGIHYYNERSISQNYAKAIDCWTKAAEQGLKESQYILGICYYEGQGVSQDYAKAVEWYTKAAKQGNEAAKKVLVEIKNKLAWKTKWFFKKRFGKK